MALRMEQICELAFRIDYPDSRSDNTVENYTATLIVHLQPALYMNPFVYVAFLA